jgi:NADPH2:quinone reductase
MKLERSVSELLAWHAAGKLRPLVTEKLPLERGPEAIALLTERKAFGRVLVEVRR